MTPHKPTITCAFPTTKEAESWAQDLQAALGQDAHVVAWSAGDAPAAMAVVWKPSQAFFDAQPQLQAVFVAGAGVDALMALHLPAHLAVVRLEDAGMATQMVDYVSYGVLRFFREFDRYEQHAQQRQWRARAPQRRGDWPVGLLGCGTLGQPVALALQQMGFPVQAWARRAKPDATMTVHVGQAGLPTFLRATRVLVCMLPLTPDTRHLINAHTLALLMPGACVINVARGGHVNEADLLAALDQGHLHAALLDVCEDEPAAPNHPLWSHPRVTLTPHIAAATLREDAVAQMAHKIRQLQRGLAITGVVQRHGY
jgi:glyoxylate/hydroxypyruvate reductase